MANGRAGGGASPRSDGGSSAGRRARVRARPDRLPARRRGDRRRHRAAAADANRPGGVVPACARACSPRRGRTQRAAALPRGRPGRRPCASTSPVPAALCRRSARRFCSRWRDRLLSILIPIEAQLPEPLFALVQDSYDRALGPLAVLPRGWRSSAPRRCSARCWSAACIAGGIAAPLQTLVGAMRACSPATCGQRLTVRRDDEIGFLAHSFNEMVAGLGGARAHQGHLRPLRLARRRRRGAGRRAAAGGRAARGDDPVPGRARLHQSRRAHRAARSWCGSSTACSPRWSPRSRRRAAIIRQFTGDGVMALFGAPVAPRRRPGARRARRAGRWSSACRR